MEFEDADNNLELDDFENAEDPQQSLIIKGRYNLPHPVTGMPARWTRATNYIEPLEDMYVVRAWEKRKIIEGIAMRKDLYAEAVTLLDDDRTWKKDKLVEKCKDAAGANVGSRTGSMIHKIFDRHDLGDTTYAPEQFEGRVKEYDNELKAHGLMVVTDLMERTVINLDYNCAGTFDRGLISYDGNLYLGDTKSEKTIYGYLGKAAQLALYVNSYCMFEPSKAGYVDMPKFNKDTGYIIWVPAEGEGCELHWVDLHEGVTALEICEELRQLRSAGRRKDVMGGVCGRPSRLDMVSAYAARVRDAEMLADINVIKKEAEHLGIWGRELETMVMIRLQNLT